MVADLSSARLWSWSGALVAAGAGMLLAKGILLIATGHDRSLVPWFGLLTSAGLALLGVALWRSSGRMRWLSLVGGAGAAIGLTASLIAVTYLIGGVIPESPDAPDQVGLSYAISSAGVAIAMLALGIVIAANRSMRGRWRWFPLSLIAAQLPIFILAGAIGDSVGSEDLTDGLGLALTGVAWILLGYSLSARHIPDRATARS